MLSAILSNYSSAKDSADSAEFSQTVFSNHLNSISNSPYRPISRVVYIDYLPAMTFLGLALGAVGGAIVGAGYNMYMHNRDPLSSHILAAHNGAIKGLAIGGCVGTAIGARLNASQEI